MEAVNRDLIKLQLSSVPAEICVSRVTGFPKIPSESFKVKTAIPTAAQELSVLNEFCVH